MRRRTKVSISVDASDLERRIKALSRSVSTEVLERAVLAGAEIVRADASRRAPKRTGVLRGNIGVQVGERKHNRVDVKVGPDKKAFYGLFQELGTKSHRPQPFLRPAFRANKNAVVAKIRDVLRAAIG